MGRVDWAWYHILSLNTGPIATRGAAVAGHQRRERLRRGVRSVVQLPGGVRAGLIGHFVMFCYSALALSPQGGAAAAGLQPRERLRKGVRSATVPDCPAQPPLTPGKHSHSPGILPVSIVTL